MQGKIDGIGVDLVTPFHKHGTIDFTSLGNIIEYIIKGGVNFLMVNETAGESSTLSPDEKKAVINFVIDAVDRRIPIVVGAGGDNTQEVVDFIKKLPADEIDGIISTVPLCQKPKQRGYFLHFKTIASVSPVPLILHNPPDRFKNPLKPETIVKLATEYQNITGVKESSDSLQQCIKILHNKPDDFLFFAGEDVHALPLMNSGASGLISVLANAFPSEMAQMVTLHKSGQIVKAKKIHFRFFEIMNALHDEAFPAVIKAILEMLGLASNNLRLPVVKLRKSTYNQLKKAIEQLNIEINE